MRVLLIPARNEADTIAATVRGATLAGFSSMVIDSGSTDTTAAVAGLAGANVLAAPAGKGAALKAGLRWARMMGLPAVATMDADHTNPKHAARVAARALDAALHGRVARARYDQPGRLSARLPAAVKATRCRHLADVDPSAVLAGIAAYPLTLLERCDVGSLPDDYGVDLALLHRCLVLGAALEEVPAGPREHATREPDHLPRMATQVRAALTTETRGCSRGTAPAVRP